MFCIIAAARIIVNIVGINDLYNSSSKYEYPHTYTLFHIMIIQPHFTPISSYTVHNK